MNKVITNFLIHSVLVVISGAGGCREKTVAQDERFISYTTDARKQEIKFYWKDENGHIFGSIQHLKSWMDTHHETLVFAMNGGMYLPDNTPQGLYIEDKRILTAMDTLNGEGNFYMKPNGIFYLTTENIPVICKSENFNNNDDIRYATQSGPMLIIDGKIHPNFKQGSQSLNIRNGVGILPDNRVVFVISKKEINFYDFAQYFKKLGCKNALYLDGFVSRAYVPQQNWIQKDGNFGVMIGISERNR